MQCSHTLYFSRKRKYLIRFTTYISNSCKIISIIIYTTIQYVSAETVLTCRKWASTMFMYMSSSSRPLPMKHRCSPLATEPDSRDCFCASRRDFTDRANSEGLWSICEPIPYHYTITDILMVKRCTELCVIPL